ncbi:YbfB/YjiJ family MFS transporter [Dactylosporangium darangshiense]|uniref:YbfB/YjiJ family MFS transporter n=2 Tax=Dactylosporangium darangshiense TaxID=579108 RepID=A0ABP8DDQ1_9ACTN
MAQSPAIAAIAADLKPHMILSVPAPPARRTEPLVALGLAAGPVVALGFTRFAYALLLPAMREQLSWTFAAAGGMNTANAVGYILGALSAAWWSRRLGARAAFGWGIALSAVTLLLSAATGTYAVLAALRFLGGVTTAVTFVVGSALAARIHTGGDQPRSARLVALYMAGVGIGIVAAGLVVPAATTLFGASGWRIGWLAMGALSLLALAPAIWATRRVPDPAAPAPGATERAGLRALTPTFAWYLLFGAGYVAYMTFVVALLRTQGLGAAAEAAFFVVLGLSSATGTLTIWARVTGRLRGGRAPALVSTVVLAGVLPVLLWHGLPAALASAVVFGAAFMAGPTAATVLVRRALPPHAWTRGIALLTAAFSIGQAFGPLVSGLLSDTTGGIARGLWLSAALLALAAVAALPQREPAPSPAPHREPVTAASTR